MFRLVCMGLLAFGLALSSASSLQAASYGTFSSSTGTVSFVDVGDLNGLYGTPTVSGNSLDFSPNAFEADCALSGSCPPAPHEVSDTLTLEIDADAGQVIDTIMLSEAGDTSLFSVGAALGATTITADVFLDVLEIDGASVNSVNANAQMVFTSDGTFDTTDEGNGTHLWTGALTLDVDAVIAAANLVGRATRVELSLGNTLTAYAESGASARIEKKDLDGLAITVIPEPGSALLVGLGLAMLARPRDRSSTRS